MWTLGGNYTDRMTSTKTCDDDDESVLMHEPMHEGKIKSGGKKWRFYFSPQNRTFKPLPYNEFRTIRDETRHPYLVVEAPSIQTLKTIG